MKIIHHHDTFFLTDNKKRLIIRTITSRNTYLVTQLIFITTAQSFNVLLQEMHLNFINQGYI